MVRQINFLFILLTIIFSRNFVVAQGDGESVYGYRNGIYGCGCFQHCKCFSHYMGDYPGGFPKKTAYHPRFPEDQVWHEFMEGILMAKKVGPYHDWNATSFSNFIERPELITEYLDIIDSYYLSIESDRVRNVNFYYDLYKSPKEESKRDSFVELINTQAIAANHRLDETVERILSLYEVILKNCPHHEDYNLAFYYNKGMIDLIKGRSIM